MNKPGHSFTGNDIRKNFWPLRSFSGLCDVNFQARQWLEQIAEMLDLCRGIC